MNRVRKCLLVAVRKDEISNRAMVKWEYQQHKTQKWKQSIPVNNRVGRLFCSVGNKPLEGFCQGKGKNKREGGSEKRDHFRNLSVVVHHRTRLSSAPGGTVVSLHGFRLSIRASASGGARPRPASPDVR